MNTVTSNPVLGNILRMDAVTCLVMGALLALGASPLSELLALPSPLLLVAGIALLPIGAFMFGVALKGVRSLLPIWLIILGNVAWVATSLALLTGVVQPNRLGIVFIVAQATVVSVFAYLEWRYRPGSGM
jgi:hypothetical protein